MLVFDALVEARACEAERFTRLTLTLVGGGMSCCAGSSNERLPLGFVADCVLDGTIAGAFCVAYLPFLFSLIFSAGSSPSMGLVVRMPLELGGEATFFLSRRH